MKPVQRLAGYRVPVLWRILLAVTATLFALAPVTFLIYRSNWVHSMYRAEQRARWGIASDVAHRLERALTPSVDLHSVQGLVHEITEANPQFDIFLLSDGGKILLDFSRFPGAAREGIDIEPVKRFILRGAEAGIPIFGEDPRGTGRIIFSAAPISVGDRAGYLYINLLNQEYDHLNEVAFSASALSSGGQGLLLIFLTVPLAGLLVLFFLTRPLRQIAGALSSYEPGGMCDVSIRQNSEFGDIARAVHSMSQRIASHVQELERKDQLRRELIADISHDLRGPVATARGFVELLEEPGSELPPEKRGRFLARIGESLDALTQLLTQLFLLSQLEAKETGIRLIECNVRMLLDDLTLSYEAIASQNGISLTAAYEEDLPMVPADSSLLRRALGNLIDNALRYTPNGGRICLQASRAADSVTIEVSDTGRGISETALPYVFDRAFQEESQGDSQKGVGGLGLSIVRKIVDSHRGSVSVQSTPGEGTRFSISLPLAPKLFPNK